MSGAFRPLAIGRTLRPRRSGFTGRTAAESFSAMTATFAKVPGSEPARPPFSPMLSHVLLALRRLRQTPGYTCIALVTLALGLGVNTSMFSVVHALLFRSAPFPEAERLVMIQGDSRAGRRTYFSETERLELQPQAHALATLTALRHDHFALGEPGQPPERVHGISFSSDVGETLRVQPALGRAFVAEEFLPGRNQVVLLTDGFWRTRFGADPGVLGRRLRLDGESVEIVGVLPPSAEYRMLWGNVALWRPLNLTPDQVTYREYRAFNFIGRLKPGAAPENLAAQLAVVAAQQEKQFPQDYAGTRYGGIALHDAAMDDVGRALSWTLLGLSGFVLLIACANLANLQIARITGALRDFAIRAALGASRRTLVVQQIVESVVLAAGGGALGLAVAWWVNRRLEQSIRIDGDGGFSAPLEPATLAAAGLIALFTGVVFGIVPALYASRADVNSLLKAQARGSTTGRGHRRMRHALIVAEVALALVLLGGAAVMNRGFGRMLSRPTGWDNARVMTGFINLPESRYDKPAKRVEFFRRALDRIAALPGVEKVSLSTSLPLFGFSSERPVFLDAAAVTGTAANPVAAHVMVSHDFFATLGIGLIEGRLFPADVTADSAGTLVVNRALAQRFWPGKSAVGQRLGSLENGKPVWREVIGVVADVENAANITEPATRLVAFKPLVQEAWSYVELAVRTTTPEAMVAPVRRALAEVDPDLAVSEPGSVAQFVHRVQHNLQVVARLIAGFAALGLVLAAVGLYGVISQAVAQRAGEFGIRMALGAQPGDVLRHVLALGMRLAAIGLALGGAGAWGLGRFLESVMPRLAAPDPLGLVGVAALLFAVTVVASWFPARRATGIDPVIALRGD